MHEPENLVHADECIMGCNHGKQPGNVHVLVMT